MNFLRQLPSRLALLLIFLACAGLLGFGLFLQHVEGIEPCPLCILQRYAFVSIGLLALLGAVFNPQKTLLKLWSALLALVCITGGSVSVRQIWLQHNPPNVSTCGPDLSYMISRFPLADVLPKLFYGEGDCAKIDWTFLSLSIAEWSLICFTLFLACSIYLMLRRKSH